MVQSVAALSSARGPRVKMGASNIGLERGQEMRPIETRASVLEDANVPVKLKLSALWAALMFLYAYGDIFAYFRPGFIEEVIAGEVFAFEINQVFLLAISIYVAIPAVMVFLALMLNPRIGRWVNVVLGLVYALTILLSTIGEDYVYYFFLSFLEVAVALLIAWFAWKWPEQGVGGRASRDDQRAFVPEAEMK